MAYVSDCMSVCLSLSVSAPFARWCFHFCLWHWLFSEQLRRPSVMLAVDWADSVTLRRNDGGWLVVMYVVVLRLFCKWKMKKSYQPTFNCWPRKQPQPEPHHHHEPHQLKMKLKQQMYSVGDNPKSCVLGIMLVVSGCPYSVSRWQWLSFRVQQTSSIDLTPKVF